MARMRQEEQFQWPDHDITGRPNVRLEFKVLGALRVLGRGACFDDISELAPGSENVRARSNNNQLSYSYSYNLCNRYCIFTPIAARHDLDQLTAGRHTDCSSTSSSSSSQQ
jgi:hypothetical protein